ncbi:MAG: formylmethanofuran dehydrogenase subunit E family protein [Phycisphaerales bacterium]|nr:MAG: formylmethanofuran dehydrogenase subunit E family protein [Phycisphaerales bacterium]
MKRISSILFVLVVCGLTVGVLNSSGRVLDSSEEDHHFVGAVGGDNAYNRGQAPEDWWDQIERMHGHVGPWNVLGWRIGQAALREFDTKWGHHELDIICYVPLRTPYSCMADGLVIGTGNTLGRLDLRLAEVVSLNFIHVCLRRKDGKGPILVFRPKLTYLRRIDAPKLEELERLSRQCSEMPADALFEVTRIAPSRHRETEQ